MIQASIHPATITPISAFPAPKQPTGSILARICALEAVSEHLEQANASQVGKAFFIHDQKGALLRRGVVVNETPKAFLVYFCDVFGLMGAKPRRVRKFDTTHWRWYAGVAESNDAYIARYEVQ